MRRRLTTGLVTTALVLSMVLIGGGALASTGCADECEVHACNCLRGSENGCKALHYADCDDWIPPKDLRERCS